MEFFFSLCSAFLQSSCALKKLKILVQDCFWAHIIDTNVLRELA